MNSLKSKWPYLQSPCMQNPKSLKIKKKTSKSFTSTGCPAQGYCFWCRWHGLPKNHCQMTSVTQLTWPTWLTPPGTLTGQSSESQFQFGILTIWFSVWSPARCLTGISLRRWPRFLGADIRKHPKGVTARHIAVGLNAPLWCN